MTQLKVYSKDRQVIVAKQETWRHVRRRLSVSRGGPSIFQCILQPKISARREPQALTDSITRYYWTDSFPSRSCSLTRFLRKSAKISNWIDSAWIKAHQSISRHLIRRLGACAALSVSCHNLISLSERRIICDLVKVPQWTVLQPSAALPYPNLPCSETQTTFDRSASWSVAESLVRSHFTPDQDTIVLISRFANQLRHISAVSVWMCCSVMLTWVSWRGQMALEIFHSPHLHTLNQKLSTGETSYQSSGRLITFRYVWLPQCNAITSVISKSTGGGYCHSEVTRRTILGQQKVVEQMQKVKPSKNVWNAFNGQSYSYPPYYRAFVRSMIPEPPSLRWKSRVMYFNKPTISTFDCDNLSCRCAVSGPTK